MATDCNLEAVKKVRAPAGMELMHRGVDPETLSFYFSEFPDPVIATQADQRIVFMNRAAEKLVGRSLDESRDLFCSGIMETEIEGKWVCLAAHCLQGNSIKNGSVRLRGRQGDWISLSATATALTAGEGNPAGCIAILRDMRKDLTHQAENQDRLSMLSSILDNFPTPFFTVSNNLVITEMNQHLEALTGYSREEVVNRLTCSQVFSTPQCNTKDCLLKQSMETRSPISGIRRMILDRTGKGIPVVVHASIITDSENRVVGGFEAIRDITPVVEAEQKIQLLTEMTQEGILMVDQDHSVIFANSKMAEIAGRPKEELIGTDAAAFLPAQHILMMAEMMQNVDREHRQQLSFCSTIESNDASSKHFQAFETYLAASCIGNNVITCVYFRDLTKRIESERKLCKANSFLENIINSSVDGIVVVDTEGKVVLFNEGAERILGYSAREAIDDPAVFRRFYNTEVARENMRRMRSDQYGPTGKLNPTRISLASKDGESVPVNFSAALIKEGDREIGSVGIFSDMREHIKIRRELEEARIQLLQAEKIASLGRLAAGVAHEINNPLAGILIYADLLMKEAGKHPGWRQDLEEIIAQTLRCKEIVTRLLEFSRQPLGQRISFEVNEILDRCMELLRHQALFHDIQFDLDLQLELPQILGDPGQIQQVFTNLVINAANAMNGKGTLALNTRFNPASEEVAVKLTDTGPGIPPEIMDKIFEPFFTTKRPGDGTGLGLSVAYGIVQQHGGRIDAENSSDGGAIFTVTLPLVSTVKLSECYEYGYDGH